MGKLFPGGEGMRAFVIALLAAALLALTPLKVAFCARAEEKAGAALGVFPCAGGLALRIARARAQHRRGDRRTPGVSLGGAQAARATSADASFPSSSAFFGTADDA